MSVSHFGHSHNISSFFIITLIMVIYDQWSLMLPVRFTEGSEDGLHFLAINIFKLKHVHWVFYMHFYMHSETKILMWLTLLQYLLYCDGLEPNSQNLWGIPVLHSFSPSSPKNRGPGSSASTLVTWENSWLSKSKKW